MQHIFGSAAMSYTGVIVVLVCRVRPRPRDHQRICGEWGTQGERSSTDEPKHRAAARDSASCLLDLQGVCHGGAPS